MTDRELLQSISDIIIGKIGTITDNMATKEDLSNMATKEDLSNKIGRASCRERV